MRVTFFLGKIRKSQALKGFDGKSVLSRREWFRGSARLYNALLQRPNTQVCKPRVRFLTASEARHVPSG